MAEMAKMAKMANIANDSSIVHRASYYDQHHSHIEVKCDTESVTKHL